MITSINRINSNVTLSKGPQTKAQMGLEPIKVPTDLSFSGGEKIAEKGVSFFPKAFGVVKKFVMETVPKYAKMAWNAVSGFFRRLFSKADKVAEVAGEAAKV